MAAAVIRCFSVMGALTTTLDKAGYWLGGKILRRECNWVTLDIHLVKVSPLNQCKVCKHKIYIQV